MTKRTQEDKGMTGIILKRDERLKKDAGMKGND